MRQPVSSLPKCVVGVMLAGLAAGAIAQQTKGFLYVDGTISTFQVPGASATFAEGINDAGDIVGWFAESHRAHGFVKIGGTFRTIDVPGDSPNGTGTMAFGINNAGQIVGTFSNAAEGTHGFLYSGGTFSTTLMLPAQCPLWQMTSTTPGTSLGVSVTARGSK